MTQQKRDRSGYPAFAQGPVLRSLTCHAEQCRAAWLFSGPGRAKVNRGCREYSGLARGRAEHRGFSREDSMRLISFSVTVSLALLSSATLAQQQTPESIGSPPPPPRPPPRADPPPPKPPA